MYAVDISNKLLNQARDNCKESDNVTYLKIDLSKKGVKLKALDFALSVNVAIMPSEKKRSTIFKTISKHLCKGGHFLLVVPSLESALYSDFRLVQWNLKTGLTGAKAASELEGKEDGGNALIRQGIIEINNAPTKHYLKEQLKVLFENGPFDIVSIKKVEYYWDTEFERAPEVDERDLPLGLDAYFFTEYLRRKTQAGTGHEAKFNLDLRHILTSEELLGSVKLTHLRGCS